MFSGASVIILCTSSQPGVLKALGSSGSAMRPAVSGQPARLEAAHHLLPPVKSRHWQWDGQLDAYGTTWRPLA